MWRPPLGAALQRHHSLFQATQGPGGGVREGLCSGHASARRSSNSMLWGDSCGECGASVCAVRGRGVVKVEHTRRRIEKQLLAEAKAADALLIEAEARRAAAAAAEEMVKGELRKKETFDATREAHSPSGWLHKRGADVTREGIHCAPRTRVCSLAPLVASMKGAPLLVAAMVRPVRGARSGCGGKACGRCRTAGVPHSPPAPAPTPPRPPPRARVVCTGGWKKRWVVIDDGVMHYYVDASDRAAGRASLGSLPLRGCSVRVPTDAKNKGKVRGRRRVGLSRSPHRHTPLPGRCGHALLSTPPLPPSGVARAAPRLRT